MSVSRLNVSVFLLVVVLFSSCSILSFYPLYTADVLVRNEKIIGEWEMIESGDKCGEKDTLVWEIKQYSEGKQKINLKRDKKEVHSSAYNLNLYHSCTPEVVTEFTLHLIELNNEYYLDFYPETWNLDNSILGFHLMGVHTFAKVDLQDNEVQITWFDPDWFKEKLEENKIRINHEMNQTNVLLTAQPKELQKFVSKYSNDENAFNTDFELILKARKK